MYCVHLYGLHVYCALVDLDSSGSSGVRPTPGLTSSTQVVCVYVRAYTSTHTHPTLTPAKIEKYTRQNPYRSGVKTKMRLTPIHIELIASLPTTSLLHERDLILVQRGTLGAFRQSHMVALDVCDWIVNRECDTKGRSCGAIVFVKKQKNDQEGKGRWKRIGWGGTLCLVKRIEIYLHWGNLLTHAACLEWKDVALRTTPCTTCGPLFPMVYGRTRFNVRRERISSKHITNVIARMLTTAQVNDVGFTSKSMRKGGLSTAKRAGVPRALRCHQSGQQSKTYESDHSTDAESN